MASHRLLVVLVAAAALMSSAEAVTWITFSGNNANSSTYTMGQADQAGQTTTSFGKATPIHNLTLSAFTLSKDEITNQEYLDFLKSANGKGLISANISGVWATAAAGSYGAFLPGQPLMMFSLTSTTNVTDTNNRAWISYNGAIFLINDVSKQNLPVTFVTWYGAVLYAHFNGYSLPSEAQWEFAARGGMVDNVFGTSSGNTTSCAQANYECGAAAVGTPREVGAYAASSSGLRDMSGNVWEWCSDYYGNDYYSTAAAMGVDPAGPSMNETALADQAACTKSTCPLRTVRGGGYSSTEAETRASWRDGMLPFMYSEVVGFRVASVPPAPAPDVSGPVQAAVVATVCSVIFVLTCGVIVCAKRRKRNTNYLEDDV